MGKGEMEEGEVISHSGTSIFWSVASIFRSRDWLSANPGPVFPGSVGSCRSPNNTSFPSQALLSGAVAVAFKVQSGFNYYKKGIYKDPSCPQRSPSHAVLATGYGPNYIWVKNSWGVGWGDKGFIKFARIGKK